MQDILKSASKIILLLFGVGVLIALFTGKITEDTFKTFGLMVFTFFFAYKGSSNPEVPYAGK